jgi:N-acetylmuramoyl-L-alanine amidase
VRYGQDGVEILLKKTPRLSDNPDAPLEGVRILLDAGHGGEDNGASGCAGIDGPLEKDLNLALTLAAKARLEQLGAWVSLTRSDDSYLSLAQRLEMVNSQAPDFFISLHHNSIALTRDTLDVNGTECYWFTPQSEDLAAALTSRFAAAFGCNDRGAREDYYFVTRTTACPAVLLESGFVTTALEYERCTDEAGLWAEGGAVAEAVLSILEG